MTPTRKIQAISPAPKRAKAGKRRRDALVGVNRDKTVCAYAKCGTLFTPRRKDQRYHTQSCRKAAWFESRFTPADTLLKEVLDAAESAQTDLWWLVGGGDFAAGIQDGQYAMSHGASKEYEDAKRSEQRLRVSLFNYNKARAPIAKTS